MGITTRMERAPLLIKNTHLQLFLLQARSLHTARRPSTSSYPSPCRQRVSFILHRYNLPCFSAGTVTSESVTHTTENSDFVSELSNYQINNLRIQVIFWRILRPIKSILPVVIFWSLIPHRFFTPARLQLPWSA